MAFLDDNYLLEGESAKKLYKEIEGLPIIDPHNHGDVKEIVGDECWNDIWEVEAETDHYLWEMMRKRGVEAEKWKISNIYLGAPWWLNDNPFGMEKFLQQVSNVDLFYNLAGMVTDSRKLMSYSSRTEMFRRTLANVVGRQVDRGRMPYSVAADLVAHVSYYGPKE